MCVLLSATKNEPGPRAPYASFHCGSYNAFAAAPRSRLELLQSNRRRRPAADTARRGSGSALAGA